MLSTFEDMKSHSENLKVLIERRVSAAKFQELEDYDKSYLYVNPYFRREFSIDSISYNEYADSSYLYKILVHNNSKPEDVYTYMGYFTADKVYEYLIKEDNKVTDVYLDHIKIPLKHNISHKSVLFLENSKIKKQVDKYFYNKRLYMEKLKVVPNEFYFLYDDKKLVAGGTTKTRSSTKGEKLKENIKLDVRILEEQIRLHNDYEKEKYNLAKVKILNE